MALLGLIFDRPVKASIETIVGVERVSVPMDASISESHERTATISQNEVEDGSNIADHVRLNPERLTMEAIISDTPVTLLASGIGLGIASASQLATSAVGGVAGQLLSEVVGSGLGTLAGLLTGTPRDPADGFRFLEELWRKRTPFTVVTALKRYENMVIQSLGVPRTASIGKSLRFNITFEQIRIVSSSLITIPAFKVGGNASAQSNANLGKQAGKEAGSETSSVALRAFQSYGFFQG